MKAISVTASQRVIAALDERARRKRASDPPSRAPSVWYFIGTLPVNPLGGPRAESRAFPATSQG